MKNKKNICPAKKFSQIEDIERKILDFLKKWETKICILLLSWGIDSSTCAVLLKEKWYQIIGVHYDFWNTYKTNLPNKCCNDKDLSDAERIAKQFNFPFFNLNYQKKFKDEIIDEFIEKKSKWIPFNPCILCHKKIKYWEIFDLIKKYWIKLASWYYCKIENWELFFSKDKNKDQTFSMIMDFKKDDLKFLEFPLGKYLKSEIRCIAKNHWIESFNKKESMGLCFVWEKKVKDFIKNYCKNEKWKIFFWNWKDFEFLWKHEGLGLYEVWERSGFNKKIEKKWFFKKIISFFTKKTQKPKNLFVYKKIPEKNILILAEKEKIFHKKFYSKNFNILWDLKIWEEKKMKIKYNSNEKEVEWKIFLKEKNFLEIELKSKIQSIIPNQIFVLIDKKKWGSNNSCEWKIFWGWEIFGFFYEEKFLKSIMKL